MNQPKTEPPSSGKQEDGGVTQQQFVHLQNASIEDLQREMARRQQEQQLQQQQQQLLQKQLLMKPTQLLQQPTVPPGQQYQQLMVMKMPPRTPEPTVTITEQPKSRGLRFRYKCEGRSAGSIPGESSTNEKKTYPTIQINNFSGPAAIVVASCVTKDKPYQPHPHNLVGQDCKDGVCTIKVKGNTTVSFPNIGIQCCKRHDVEESLKTREKIRVDPFGTGYTNNIQNIDLNTVRLCFQVFLPDANKKFTRIVTPVVSHPIIDKKSIHDLVICRLSKQSGYANGGDEVFLLCEKINKDDIQVRFYQETDDGISWEAFGEFASHDVHRQFAIVFRTPPYKDPYIQQSVTVFIQLRRPSDDEVGDPKPFQYIPQERDPYGLESKRKRKEVDVSTYSDRIPMTVLQDVKDEPEGGANQDVRSRLKKKAERGLQRRDRVGSSAAAAGSALNDGDESSDGVMMPDYSTYMDTSDVIGSATAGQAIVIPAGLEALTTLHSDSVATSALLAPQIYFAASGSSFAQEFAAGNSIIYSIATGPDGATVISGGSDADNQMFMQYLKDNPAALTSIDSVSLSGLSEFNSSSGGVIMEQVSNDLNVGAQESVLDNATPERNGTTETSSAAKENGEKSSTVPVTVNEKENK